MGLEMSKGVLWDEWWKIDGDALSSPPFPSPYHITTTDPDIAAANNYKINALAAMPQCFDWESAIRNGLRYSGLW